MNKNHEVSVVIFGILFSTSHLIITSHLMAKTITAKEVYCAFANRYGVSVASMKKIIKELTPDTLPSSRSIINSLKTLLLPSDHLLPTKRKVDSSAYETAKEEMKKILSLLHSQDASPNAELPKIPESETDKKVRDCCICFDPVEISKAKSEALECPRCNACYCYRCLIDMITSTRNLLVCASTNCDIPFDEFVMYPYFSKARITSFRSKIKECLLDAELSLLDMTRRRIYETGHYARFGNTIIDISGQPLSSEPSQSKKKREVVKTVGIRMCGVGGCAGFLDQRWTCEVCKERRCSKCHVQISISNASETSDAQSSETSDSSESETRKHVCKPEDVESVEMIRRESSACPKCGEYTSRIDGCSHLFCVACKTSFIYRQGAVGKFLKDSLNTNPEYYKYKREQAKLAESAAQSSGDSGDSQRTMFSRPSNPSSSNSLSSYDEVPLCRPGQANLPPDVHVLETMAMALCKKGDIATALHIHRMARNDSGSEVTSYLDLCLQQQENRDCEYLRELLILAKNKTVVNLQAFIEDPSYFGNGDNRRFRTKGMKVPVMTLAEYLLRIGGTLALVLNSDGTYSESKILDLLKKRALVIYREQQRHFHYRNLLQTFKVACADIIRNILSYSQTLQSCHGAKHTPGEVYNVEELTRLLESFEAEILTHLRAFDGLRVYVNDTFREIATVLGYNVSTVPGISAKYSFVRNISAPKEYEYHNVDFENIRAELMKYTCKLYDFVSLVTKFAPNSGDINFANKGIVHFGDPGKLSARCTNGGPSHKPRHEIRKLNLSGNAFTHVSFSTLNADNPLYFLRELDLSCNSLFSIRRTFESLDYLEVLNLSGCSIRHIEPGAFEKNVNLIYLILSDNKIKNVEKMSYLTPMNKKIRHLDLSRNIIQTLDLNNLPPSLESLFLRGCKISSVTPRAGRHFFLKNLCMQGNHIQEIGQNFLKGLEEITKLELSDCRIRKVHPSAFIGCPFLELIDLKENLLTELPLTSIDADGEGFSRSRGRIKKIMVKGNLGMPGVNKCHMDLSIIGIHGYLLIGTTFGK